MEHRPKRWALLETCGDKDEAKGSYYSPSSVTLMIARELKREINKEMNLTHCHNKSGSRRGRRPNHSGRLSKPPTNVLAAFLSVAAMCHNGCEQWQQNQALYSITASAATCRSTAQ